MLVCIILLILTTDMYYYYPAVKLSNYCPQSQVTDIDMYLQARVLNQYAILPLQLYPVNGQKIQLLSFPGGTVIESPPADAGDTGSCPGPGGSHMPRSGWAHEPGPLSLRIRSLCSATGEATTVRDPCTAKKTKQNKKLTVC